MNCPARKDGILPLDLRAGKAEAGIISGNRSGVLRQSQNGHTHRGSRVFRICCGGMKLSPVERERGLPVGRARESGRAAEEQCG